METLKHLVIVIPGIGGSVLEDADGTSVWGGNRRSIVGTVLRPASLSVSERPQLRAVALLHSFTVLPPLVVHGYDRMVTQIRRWFPAAHIDLARPDREPDLGADVVLFPYDFRLGVCHAAERLKTAVDRRLDGISQDERRRRVIVVAHSLGGLVARYWLGPLGGAGDCRALVTLGTPHRGAPKALDWLINGARAGPLPLRTATDVLREWPSVYDLLPRYPAVLDEGTGDMIYPRQLPGTSEAFRRSAEKSYAMHRTIEAEWSALEASQRPDVIAVFSRGHGTLSAARLAHGDLVVTPEDPDWLPNAGWRGDGTVPAISAIPIELDDDQRSWQAVPERHGPMGSAVAVAEILRSYSGASLQPVRGTAPGRPWLGADIDDCIPAGTALRVRARLYGIAPDAGDSLWLTIRPTDTSGPPVTHRLHRSADGWEAVTDGLAPGIYSVRVESAGHPEIVPVTELVAVIE